MLATPSHVSSLFRSLAGAPADAVEAQIAAYSALLAHHDWQYEFSDDGSVYRAGAAERGQLHMLRRFLDEDSAIWNRFAPEGYQIGIPFPAAPAPAFTAGPWKLNDASNDWIRKPGGVTSMSEPFEGVEQKPYQIIEGPSWLTGFMSTHDASLIAAAPLLYAKLAEVVKALESGYASPGYGVGARALAASCVEVLEQAAGANNPDNYPSPVVVLEAVGA